jgi:hypothetical protein
MVKLSALIELFVYVQQALLVMKHNVYYIARDCNIWVLTLQFYV